MQDGQESPAHGTPAMTGSCCLLTIILQTFAVQLVEHTLVRFVGWFVTVCMRSMKLARAPRRAEAGLRFKQFQHAPECVLVEFCSSRQVMFQHCMITFLAHCQLPHSLLLRRTVEDGLSQLEATLQRYTATGAQRSTHQSELNGSHSTHAPAPSSVQRPKGAAARPPVPSSLAPPSSRLSQPSSLRPQANGLINVAHGPSMQGGASNTADGSLFCGTGDGDDEWEPQPRRQAPPSPSPPSSPRAAWGDAAGSSDRMPLAVGGGCGSHSQCSYPTSPTKDAVPRQQEAARTQALGSFGAWVVESSTARRALPSSAGVAAAQLQQSQPRPQTQQPLQQQRPPWGGGGGGGSAIRAARPLSPGREAAKQARARSPGKGGWSPARQNNDQFQSQLDPGSQQAQRATQRVPQGGANQNVGRISPPRVVTALGAGGAGGTWSGRVASQQGWEGQPAAGQTGGGRPSQSGRPQRSGASPAVNFAAQAAAHQTRFRPEASSHQEYGYSPVLAPGGDDARTPQPRQSAPAPAYPTIHLHLPPDNSHGVEVGTEAFTAVPSPVPEPRAFPVDALYGHLPPSASPPQQHAGSHHLHLSGFGPVPVQQQYSALEQYDQPQQYNEMDEQYSELQQYDDRYDDQYSGQRQYDQLEQYSEQLQYSELEQYSEPQPPHHQHTSYHVRPVPQPSAEGAGQSLRAGPGQLSRTAEALQRLAQRLRPVSRRLSGEQP